MFSPLHFNIDADEWRPGQYEAVEWALSPNRKRVSIISAMTGSGKSKIGASLGSQGRTVRTLTATRALQSQYSLNDGFEALFGTNAYPCTLFGQGLGFTDLTAEHCVYPTNMRKCPAHKECECLIRKDATQNASRQALSYAYFFTSDWPKSSTDYLFCDEAHNVPDLLMSNYTLEVDQYICSVLEIKQWASQIGTRMAKWGVGKELVIQFLYQSQADLEKQINQFPRDPKKISPSMAIKISSLKGWKSNMERVERGLRDGYPYHIELTSSEQHGKPERGDRLIISPLSARDFFKPAFLDSAASKIVLTSATIGDTETFGGLIGLEPDNFDYHAVPARFAPEDMPIYVPVNAPYVNYNSPDADIQRQAELIKQLIDSTGKLASGLVHFTSKRATYDMAERLARLGFQDRIYVTPEVGGTEERMMAYKEYQKSNPGAIHLTWCFWEGYDGWDDNFSIVAKAPYPQESELIKLQRKFDGGRYYNWKTAIMIEQGIGRVRRGDPSHYGKSADKLTAIVDRTALRLKSYFSEHFQQCLETA